MKTKDEERFRVANSTPPDPGSSLAADPIVTLPDRSCTGDPTYELDRPQYHVFDRGSTWKQKACALVKQMDHLLQLIRSCPLRDTEYSVSMKKHTTEQNMTTVEDGHNTEDDGDTKKIVEKSRRNTLVFVLNRSKWFKLVCWNSFVVVTQIGLAIREHARVLWEKHCDVQSVTMCNRSLKQTAISLISCEAEFYAASACAGELLGLAELFKELHYKVSVLLEMDSDSVRHILQLRRPGGLKHIEIRCL